MKNGRYKLLEGACRMCQRPETIRPLTRHHIVPRRPPWHGPDRNENIVPLCRPCHDLVDCGPHERRGLWRRMLRRCLTPGEVTYARRRLGRHFDRLYPPLAPEKAEGPLARAL